NSPSTNPHCFHRARRSNELEPISLHDALPICGPAARCCCRWLLLRHTHKRCCLRPRHLAESSRVLKSPPSMRHSLLRFPCRAFRDRKSTRLNSSHVKISYAVFCLKKQNVMIYV